MSSKSPLDTLGTALATLGPVGNFPKAPGTWGSLAAAVAAPWLFLPFSLPVRCAILVFIFFLGIWACSRAEKVLGQKDPCSVVIDELFGQWITLLLFTAMPIWYLGLAFVLFRAFDILKPWPIRWAETAFPGGLGVMMDDGIAGLFALCSLELIRSLLTM